MRPLLLTLFGATDAFLTGRQNAASKPKYPSTSEMVRMRDVAMSLGSGACLVDQSSAQCRDYNVYWRDSSDPTITNKIDLSEVKKEDSKKASQQGFGKLLIISVGETFRSGGRLTVGQGTDSSVEPQHDAVNSNLAFARYV